MTIRLLLLLLLLFITVSASAQTAPAVTTPTDSTLVLTSQRTAADTIRALQRLFKKRRTLGGVLLGATGAFTALAMSEVVESGGNAAFFSGPSAYVFTGVLVAIITAPLYIPAIAVRSRYSKNKEAVVINDFMAKKGLPDKYKRALKPGLFLQSSSK